jgi:predicted lipoprotein with Yx(FWY)xxD motif
MNRLVLFAFGAGALGAVAAGCGSSGMSSSSGTTSSGQASSSVVKTSSTPVGQVLTDGNGRTLYLLKTDTGTMSTCTGSCASTWPPDTVSGKATASGVNASMLGTTTRSDHTTQVTFDGHPLYYYSGDAAAGQVNGQGIQGTWFTVSPSGSADTTTPAPSTTGGSGGGYGY